MKYPKLRIILMLCLLLAAGCSKKPILCIYPIEHNITECEICLEIVECPKCPRCPEYEECPGCPECANTDTAYMLSLVRQVKRCEAREENFMNISECDEKRQECRDALNYCETINDNCEYDLEECEDNCS